MNESPGTPDSSGSSPEPPPAEPGQQSSEAVSIPPFQPFADPPPAADPGLGATPVPPVPPTPESAWNPMPVTAGEPTPAASTDVPDPQGYVPLPTGMAPDTTTPGVDPAAVPTSAWVGSTAAPPKKRSRVGAILGTIGVVVVLVIVGFAVGNLLGPNNKGEIIFGLSAGSDFCSVGDQTTSVNAGTPVYFSAILEHHMDGDQAVTLKVTKDGQDFGSLDEPADGKAFDCLAGKPDVLGQLDAGAYHFELFHNTDLESKGDLTVK